ncbi:DUF11 domain-containing protein [Kribbella sancticallisti]|uniref:DUF11 domain-containing protein n=2 Tax=Kribbella sancticallisti TaxID=460087 RepID=A0ABN2DAP4_9ACTN
MVGASLVAAPQVATAAEPSSAVVVSPLTIRPGETFTVTQTVHNSQAFTITGGKAGLYGKELSLPTIVELVSCPGAFACDVLGTSVRGGVGEVAGGESRTVVFTFRLKDDAPVGQFTLQHQFIGENYAFEILDGPVITIAPPLPAATDLAVSLNATARGLLTSRITYTITVRNDGPADATGVRLTGAYPAGLVFASSSGCTRVAGTRTVTCDVPALATGATATRSFSADAALLSLGSLVATAERTQSTPDDSNPANDRATRTCTALTGLLVRC